MVFWWVRNVAFRRNSWLLIIIGHTRLFNLSKSIVWRKIKANIKFYRTIKEEHKLTKNRSVLQIKPKYLHLQCINSYSLSWWRMHKPLAVFFAEIFAWKIRWWQSTIYCRYLHPAIPCTQENKRRMYRVCRIRLMCSEECFINFLCKPFQIYISCSKINTGVKIQPFLKFDMTSYFHKGTQISPCPHFFSKNFFF